MFVVVMMWEEQEAVRAALIKRATIKINETVSEIQLVKASS